MSKICVRRGQSLCVMLVVVCLGAVVWCGLAKSQAKGDRRAKVNAKINAMLRAQAGRIDVRLRSFAPNASGQLTIEPSAEGGRARLTALGLPDPQSQSRGAQTYVVWANSEGRIVRLGELRTDRRGNGGLSFTHPGFERYTVIVTAEQAATADKPFGAPILSTRANEATALFAVPNVDNTPSVSPDPTPVRARAARRVAPGDFYSEVEGALDARGGGRLIELEGAEFATRARGRARATEQAGRAYVVLRFSDLPLPRTVDAKVYVLWALLPNSRIVYMGSLPADETLNLGTTYVRVHGFDTDRFDLFVTGERARPMLTPSDRRALFTRNAVNTIR